MAITSEMCEKFGTVKIILCRDFQAPSKTSLFMEVYCASE